MPYRLYIFSALVILLCSMRQQDDAKTTTLQTVIDSFLRHYESKYNISKRALVSGDSAVSAGSQKMLLHQEITLTSKTLTLNQYKQKSHLRLKLHFQQYENESQCQAATKKFMDCFGTDCNKLTWGDTSRSYKTVPSIFIFTKTEIISCRASCEQAGSIWEIFRKDVEKAFGKGSYKVIETKCGGKPSFRSY